MGLVTLFLASAIAEPPVIGRQPVSQSITEGEFTAFGVFTPPVPPATFQWFKDGNPILGANGANLQFFNPTPSDCGHYQVRLDSQSLDGSTWSRKVELRVAPQVHRPGMIDTTFSADDIAGDRIDAIAVAPDGSIYIGGKFSTVGGFPAANIARLLPNGAIDPAFTARTNEKGRVRAILIRENQILIAGDFTECNDTPCSHIAALHPLTGALESTFGAGANSSILTLALDTANRLLGGGTFTTFDGTPAPRLVRILPDDTTDLPFNAPHASQLNADVEDIALYPDGRILLAGGFTKRVTRLLPNGTPDPAFAAHKPSLEITDITLLPDGHIIAAGGFEERIIKLDPNGQLDPKFDPCPNGFIDDLQTTPAGHILAAGEFTKIDGQNIRTIARILPDGSLDTTFRPPSFNEDAFAACIDGETLLLGGRFDRPHNNIIRLRLDQPTPETTAPEIICQPRDHPDATPGQLICLDVGVTRPATVAYQWHQNGTPIPDATQQELRIQNFDDTKAGHYTVTISNAYGTITSQTAQITAAPVPLGLEHSRQYSATPDIPFKDLTTANIQVSESFPVHRIRLHLRIEHPKANDLEATLRAPNGQSISLFRRPGRRGSNMDTTFDDEAFDTLEDGAAPWHGTWKPDNPLATLATIDAAGTWQLDIDGRIRPGILQHFILEFIEPPAPVTYAAWQTHYFGKPQPDSSIDTNNDGSPDFLAFALLADPHQPLLPLQDIKFQNGRLHFSHHRWQNAPTLDYQYQILQNGQWQPIQPQLLRQQNLGNNRQHLHFRLNNPPNPRRTQLRLRIVQ